MITIVKLTEVAGTPVHVCVEKIVTMTAKDKTANQPEHTAIVLSGDPKTLQIRENIAFIIQVCTAHSNVMKVVNV